MRSYLGLVLGLALVTASGCGGDDGDSGNGGGTGGKTGAKDSGSGTEKAATFTQVYKDVIVATGCNGGALCHGGIVGMLTMKNQADSYKALVDIDAMGTNLVPGKPDCKDSGLKRVVPKDPDNSLMMQKVEGSPPCGDAMPPTDMKLADDKVELIRSWIKAGAKDD